MDKIWIYVWKQRKLGEIVNRITRKNSKLISELPLTISAQQGLIDQNEFFDKRVASKDVSGYYLIKNGEFAYNRSTSNDAPWGAIKRLDRYENGVLSTLYIVFEIKDETLVNSDFLVAYYNTNLWHKGIHEIAAEGARNHGLLNIAPTDFFKTKLKLPADIEEQQEIGEYFKKIDSLITFHHRKLNILNKICRYAWEQRKLGDLVIIERGGSPRPINKFITEDENGLNWVKIGDAPERGNYITQTKEKIRYEGLSKTREVHPGDLILSNSMSFGRPYIMAIDGCIHDGWLLIRDNEKRFDLKYLCYMLGTDMMLSQYKQMAAGSTVNNLNKELVGNTVVKYPSPEEQSKMGDYFSIFDNLIALHQQKCKQLQIIRKFMLKNMFL